MKRQPGSNGASSPAPLRRKDKPRPDNDDGDGGCDNDHEKKEDGANGDPALDMSAISALSAASAASRNFAFPSGRSLPRTPPQETMPPPSEAVSRRKGASEVLQSPPQEEVVKPPTAMPPPPPPEALSTPDVSKPTSKVQEATPAPAPKKNLIPAGKELARTPVVGASQEEEEKKRKEEEASARAALPAGCYMMTPLAQKAGIELEPKPPTPTPPPMPKLRKEALIQQVSPPKELLACLTKGRAPTPSRRRPSKQQQQCAQEEQEVAPPSPLPTLTKNRAQTPSRRPPTRSKTPGPTAPTSPLPSPATQVLSSLTKNRARTPSQKRKPTSARSKQEVPSSSRTPNNKVSGKPSPAECKPEVLSSLTKHRARTPSQRRKPTSRRPKPEEKRSEQQRSLNSTFTVESASLSPALEAELSPIKRGLPVIIGEPAQKEVPSEVKAPSASPEAPPKETKKSPLEVSSKVEAPTKPPVKVPSPSPKASEDQVPPKKRNKTLEKTATPPGPPVSTRTLQQRKTTVQEQARVEEVGKGTKEKERRKTASRKSVKPPPQEQIQVEEGGKERRKTASRKPLKPPPPAEAPLPELSALTPAKAPATKRLVFKRKRDRKDPEEGAKRAKKEASLSGAAASEAKSETPEAKRRSARISSLAKAGTSQEKRPQKGRGRKSDAPEDASRETDTSTKTGKISQRRSKASSSSARRKADSPVVDDGEEANASYIPARKPANKRVSAAPAPAPAERRVTQSAVAAAAAAKGKEERRGRLNSTIQEEVQKVVSEKVTDIEWPVVSLD